MKEKVKKGVNRVEIFWSGVGMILNKLRLQLENEIFASVVAIYRSGMVAGVYFSHVLKKKLGVIKVNENNEVEILGELKEPILLVDDVLETGETLKRVLKVLREKGYKNVKVAVMVVKGEADKDVQVDYVGKYYTGNAYVWFPWEISCSL